MFFYTVDEALDRETLTLDFPALLQTFQVAHQCYTAIFTSCDIIYSTILST